MNKMIINHTIIYRLVCIFLILLGLFIILRQEYRPTENTINGFYFDTYISIKINDDITTSEKSSLINLVCTYDTILSPYLEDSLAYKLGNNRSFYVTNEDEYSLNDFIETTLEIAHETKGVIDPTIMSVYELYDFDPSNDTSPDQSDIEAALKGVDYSSLQYENNILTLTNSSSKIGFGFIAKGYIADKIKEQLIRDGIDDALINLGGNVLALGDNNGKGYNVAVQNPFRSLPKNIFDNYNYPDDLESYIASLNRKELDLNAEYALTINISDKSVVTSGIYERYYLDNGTIMHHLLDSKSGKPVNNELVSVTIIGPSSTYCDSYSTACFLMGLKNGIEYINEKCDYQAIFITKKGDIIYSDI